MENQYFALVIFSHDTAAGSIDQFQCLITFQNKKVLLRERKRHTARRVVSTPSVVLPGYPPPGGGTRISVPPPGGGYPDLGTPPPQGGYPDLGTPPGGGVPGPWYPPPRLPHGILGNVAKHYGIWVPPPLWTDRLMDGQTRVKTLPSLVLRTRAVMSHPLPLKSQNVMEFQVLTHI